ncbi:MULTISPECIES: hypothetical protein [unclassified Knoellia]|uniref:hypothetical protein n=1 Tax=Knoellia altitudinis TaxID=3404795 RepID=UPI003623B03B
MSETFGSGGASGASGDEVRDEVRLDLDEEKLDAWEDVRADYAVDPDSEVARPGISDSDESQPAYPDGSGHGDDRVLVEGERHDDLEMSPDGTSAEEE